MCATEKQKKAMDLRNKEIEKGNYPAMGKILKKVGYSDAMAHNPKRVTDSKGWQELMASYDDKEKEIIDAVVDDSLGKDKRVAVQNRNIFFKMRGRFQENININDYSKELKSLIPDEQDNSGEIEEESSKED